MIMQNYLYGAFRWPWISELYEYVQTVHLLPAVISVILNPRKPTFKVTAKDESISTSRISEIGMPFFVIFGILLLAVAMTVYKVYAEPFKADVTLVVGGWNLLNLIIAGCALGVVSERGERAASRRVKVSRRCDLEVGGRWRRATIEDVSVNGARVVVFGAALEEFARDDVSAIRFKMFADGTEGVLPVTVRNFERTTDSIAVGCYYFPSEANHHRLIADLLFANSKQWEQFQLSRRGNPGLIRGTLRFLRLAFYQTGRGLVYLGRALRSRRPADVPQPAPTIAERRA
jgi:cellulose synthase (UDP-forming)